MSRQLRRVPLDFDWPLDKVWTGFVQSENLPPLTPCPDCVNPLDYRKDSDGLTAEARAVAEMFYANSLPYELGKKVRWCDKLGQAEVENLAARGRLIDFTHTWTKGEGWVENDPATVPTAAQVNEWDRNAMGHDAINRWILIEFRCEALGITMRCLSCDGAAIVRDPELEKLHDEWEGTPPPTGDGYQLWETCSEGSPQTPVFETLDALCEYAADHCTTFAANRATAAEWKAMLEEDFVRTEVVGPDGQKAVFI